MQLRTPALSLLLASVLLSGCGTLGGIGLPGFGGRSATPQVVTIPVAPAVPPADDALAVFVASAGPGQTGMVQGQPARLLRSYNAASGRECREVLLGTGISERTAVACRGPDGTFASSRPLLRGSAR